MTAPAWFSSSHDPKLGPARRQFTLRHFFALTTVCCVALVVYTQVKRISRPTEFLDAAQRGDLVSLRRLLNLGVDVSHKDGWSTTALMMASVNGHAECVRHLVENGADPNERSRFNATPLIRAAESGSLETVKFLIENGADPSLTDSEGMTAVDRARKIGRQDIVDCIER